MANSAKDIRIRELLDTISELNELIKSQQTIIHTMSDRENELNQQIRLLREQVDYLTKKLFGRSSEKRSKDIPGQLSFFNEAEMLQDADPGTVEEEIPVPEPAGKPRKKKTTKADKYAGLPVKKVYLDIPEEDRFCSECGTPLERIGEEYLRSELDFIPAKARIIRYYSVTYKCPNCTDHLAIPTVVKGKDGKPHMLHGMASASTIAWIMHQKFVNALPLYRQEEEFRRLGAPVERTTMASWMIANAMEFFLPMFDFFHRRLIELSFAMADESPLQVLKEPDRRPETKSYMWLFRSGEVDEPPIVLYKYSPTRAGANARDFLEGFHGYLMCDGYSGYNHLPNVRRTSCWAHVRRYLTDAIPKGKQSDYSQPAVQGVLYVSRLFEIERAIREQYSTSDAIKEARLRKEKPVLEAFWAWLDEQNPERNTRMDKAVTYIRNRKADLEIYLEDGHCSFSNNASERSIKQFVIGRKNWLFCDTPAGADASALIYSMVETAKANGVNPYYYLKFLLESCPIAAMSDEELEKFAPWNEDVKERLAREYRDSPIFTA